MPYGNTINSKKMKIGILTFHCAINFGAVLQAFGLFQYLRSLGHDVSVIDYRPDYLIKPYRPFNLKRIKEGRSKKQRLFILLREVLALHVRYGREKLFRRFIKDHIHLSPLQLDDKANDFDAFVFGSDQIWNRWITQSDMVFWGEAPAFEGKRRIAYAASAGSVNDLDEDAMSNLERFDAVSVRERNLADYLKSLTTKKIYTVLDPVLLAGKEFYSAIATTKHRSPYLLYFSLEGDAKLRPIVEILAKKRNLELIEVMSSNICFTKGNVQHVLSINDFLGLFLYADFVVTKSFHGTAFSILFERDFMVYYDGQEAPERMSSLLHALGLGNHLRHIDEPSIASFPINWKDVNDRLEQMRISSRQFLAEALA